MESAALPPPLPGSSPERVAYRFSKAGLLLALVAVAVCVVFVIFKHAENRVAETGRLRPNVMLEMLARYAVGVKGLLESTGQSSTELTGAMLKDVGTLARSEGDSLRVLILKSWMGGDPPSEAELDETASRHPALEPDVRTLKQWIANGEADEESWKELRRHHGWMASLARAGALSKDDPMRRQVVRQGIRTAVVLIGVTLFGMLMVVGGLVLLILGLVRWREGKLRMTMRMGNAADGGVLVEGFAIYLALFLMMPWLMGFLPVQAPRWAAYGPALLALMAGLLWPLLRGMERPVWRETLGLHRGGGWWREIRAGLAGWLATLPLLVVGMIAASWITKLTGEFPSHPIVDVFTGSAWAKFGAIVLAVVWAPVSEELMFRGLLFPGLSAWVRWVPGALVGAFVFAAIHPQGWAGVPALMALAFSFSMLRMWRRSLIAPMTAHALNNGIMCAVMLLLW